MDLDWRASFQTRQASNAYEPCNQIVKFDRNFNLVTIAAHEVRQRRVAGAGLAAYHRLCKISAIQLPAFPYANSLCSNLK